MKGGRARWGGPLAALAGTAVALLLAEALLRLAFPQPLLGRQPRFVPLDGPQRFQLAPGQDFRAETLDGGYTVRTSPSGNRGRDPERPLPRDRKGVVRADSTRPLRVVFCGDSFCFGMGVEEEESIPARCAVLLRGEGRTVEVFNLGQPAYGPSQTAARLLEFLQRWGADRVVFLFFTGNDFFDDDPGRLASLRVDRRGRIIVSAEPNEGRLRRWSAPLREWLWRHSMLYSLLRRTASGLRPAAEARSLFDPAAPGGDARRAAIVRKSLEMMAAMCRRSGAELLVAQLPALVQADDGWWRGLDRGEELDRWAPQEWLARTCGELGIAHLDLAPVLSPLGRRAFLPTDRHLTPEASDIVARALAEALAAPHPGRTPSLRSR